MRINSRIVSISNGKINMGPYHEYMAFYPETAGILCKKTNKPPKEGFIFKRETSTTQVPIPPRLRIAYGLYLQVEIEDLDEERIFIRQKLKEKEIPVPLPLHSLTKAGGRKLKRKPDGEVIAKKNNILYFSNIFPKEWKMRKISVYAEDCLRIEISDATDPELQKGIPTRKAYQFDFGARYQYFPGKSMTFLHEVKTANTYRALNVPKFFWEEAGVKEGDRFDWYKTTRKGETVYVFTQKPKSCELTGQTIRPEEEKPEQVILCEDCAEDKDDLGALIKEIEELKGLVRIAAKNCIQVQKENLSLLELVQKMGGGAHA